MIILYHIGASYLVQKYVLDKSREEGVKFQYIVSYLAAKLIYLSSPFFGTAVK